MSGVRRDDATVRGVVVLLVAVVVGLALLARGGSSGDSAASTTEPPEGSSTAVPSITESTLAPVNDPTASSAPTTRAVGEVTVIVLNGTRQAGIAGDNEAKVEGAGYQTISASNSSSPADTTRILFAEGFQADAEAVKEILGVDAPVEPAPAEPLAPTAGDANVVILLGADYEGGG